MVSDIPVNCNNKKPMMLAVAGMFHGQKIYKFTAHYLEQCASFGINGNKSVGSIFFVPCL